MLELSVSLVGDGDLWFQKQGEGGPSVSLSQLRGGGGCSAPCPPPQCSQGGLSLACPLLSLLIQPQSERPDYPRVFKITPPSLGRFLNVTSAFLSLTSFPQSAKTANSRSAGVVGPRAPLGAVCARCRRLRLPERSCFLPERSPVAPALEFLGIAPDVHQESDTGQRPNSLSFLSREVMGKWLFQDRTISRSFFLPLTTSVPGVSVIESLELEPQGSQRSG